jgi:cutinase
VAVIVSVTGQASAVATRNDVTTCHATTVVSVRGMGEGWSATGDGFLSPLVDKVTGSDVNAISLQYQNDGVEGMNAGGDILAKLMDDLQTRCPNTKLVVAGWSLGGGVIKGALSKSNPSILVAAATFGSVPFNGSLPAGDKFRAWCAAGDGVCGNSGPPGGHGSYMGGIFLEESTAFINSKLGGGSDPGTTTPPTSSPASSPMS